MRLLILEDDPQLGDALAAGLRQLDHAVDWFRDGTQADAAIGGAPYDALVLDLGLPGTDGMTWLRRWRQRGQTLPVLILTARDGVEQRIAGLDAGADDYLIKPITIDELAARLRAMLRRASGRSQALWTHGALCYDPAAKQVQWQGQPVELTGRELALLELLLLQPAACAVAHTAAGKALRLERRRTREQRARGLCAPPAAQDPPGHRAHRARRRLCARRGRCPIMKSPTTCGAGRAERRAAPKPARVPPGDRPRYAAGEGSS